jgi:hypothetical protein
MAQAWQRKRGTARRLPAAAMCACLSACAVPPAAVPPQAAQPVDPVLQAVAAGKPNLPQTLAAGTVTVTSDYISAAGQECRAYTLAPPGAAPASKLACNDGGWRDIPPLLPTPGYAP